MVLISRMRSSAESMGGGGGRGLQGLNKNVLSFREKSKKYLKHVFIQILLVLCTVFKLFVRK